MAGRRRQALLRQAAGGATILLGKSLRRLPLPWARAVARVAARLVYHLIPRVKRVGLANLELAYGDALTEKERRRILMQAVENMTTVAAEFPRTPDLTGDFLHANVAVENEEALPRGRGCIVIGGHIGNWEWLATAMAGRGWKTAEVVRPLDDPWLNAYVDKTRRGGGVVTIPKLRAAQEMIAHLDAGYVVGVLVDQSPRRNGVPAHFFGKPCWATIGAVMIALRAHVPIHAVAMVREPSGRYVLKFTPEIQMVKTKNLRADLLENVQRCQDAIETMIRDHPGQWLWLHRRWKRRPHLEQAWAEKLKQDGTNDSSGAVGASR